MKIILTIGSLALAVQASSAAVITFDGRTSVASEAPYNLTDMGTTDWAYWDQFWQNGDSYVSGAATNDMDGGFGIGSISLVGTGAGLRGTASAAIDTEFSYSNGTTAVSGTEEGVTGLFSEEIGKANEGVELAITLAEAGQEYTINIWTGAYATQYGSVVASLSGATSYTSGNTGGSGGSGWYGDNSSPREPYLYTFSVVADNPNDVFNFSITTAGSQNTSSHVLIAAATVAAVPEANHFALLAGLGVMGVILRRRR